MNAAIHINKTVSLPEGIIHLIEKDATVISDIAERGKEREARYLE
jgi:hypothetical protein